MFAAENHEVEEFLKDTQYYYDRVPKRFVKISKDDFKELDVEIGESKELYSLNDFRKYFTLSGDQKLLYNDTVLLHWSIWAGKYSIYSGCFSLEKKEYEILSNSERLIEYTAEIAKLYYLDLRFNDCVVDESPDYYDIDRGYERNNMSHDIEAHFKYEASP
jgi:hypothetical protein